MYYERFHSIGPLAHIHLAFFDGKQEKGWILNDYLGGPWKKIIS